MSVRRRAGLGLTAIAAAVLATVGARSEIPAVCVRALVMSAATVHIPEAVRGAPGLDMSAVCDGDSYVQAPADPSVPRQAQVANPWHTAEIRLALSDSISELRESAQPGRLDTRGQKQSSRLRPTAAHPQDGTRGPLPLARLHLATDRERAVSTCCFRYGMVQNGAISPSSAISLPQTDAKLVLCTHPPAMPASSGARRPPPKMPKCSKWTKWLNR